jgi:hypothetical protein
MAYKYNHLIPQNIAPKGTKRIGVYNNNDELIYTIPLGKLTPINKEKLYSFALLSDIHLFKNETTWLGNTEFDNTLSCFDSTDRAFCMIRGD